MLLLTTQLEVSVKAILWPNFLPMMAIKCRNEKSRSCKSRSYFHGWQQRHLAAVVKTDRYYWHRNEIIGSMLHIRRSVMWKMYYKPWGGNVYTCQIPRGAYNDR
jgi:hypothetical protein